MDPSGDGDVGEVGLATIWASPAALRHATLSDITDVAGCAPRTYVLHSARKRGPIRLSAQPSFGDAAAECDAVSGPHE
ncbi:hypothetical protein GCM10009657_41070 [Oryzihumus leptocrescens]